MSAEYSKKAVFFQVCLVVFGLGSLIIVSLPALFDGREVKRSSLSYLWQKQDETWQVEDEPLENKEVSGVAHHMAGVSFVHPEPRRRCPYVIERTIAHNGGKGREMLQRQFQVQSKDPNMFYRGFAYIFWEDFVRNGWGYNISSIIPNATLPDGSPLARTSTYCWITGDQHLSNFGAWRNRQGKIVYSVNDFDEAAIYDFQIDIWRLATSIYDHAITNNLSRDESYDAVYAFAHEYVGTVINYLNNDDALLYELTTATINQKAHTLANFLLQVKEEETLHKQLGKFTYLAQDGKRRFLFNNSTKLAPVDPELKEDIIIAMSKRGYGATLQRIGWKVHEWDDNYFEVRDVGLRIGSGDGSFGVSRYYVLLAGSDNLVNQFLVDGVILDVKYEPTPAIRGALLNDERLWFETLFRNEGERCVRAQRRLTSYTDPFLGYATIRGKVFVVRQRSPWKASFDFSSVPYSELKSTFRQVAVVTATSHVRGSESKAPVMFKQVIASALGPPSARSTWAASIAHTAAAYREQVLLDFECFSHWIQIGAPIEPQPDESF